MADPRINKMAAVIVDHSIRAKKGEQILINSSPLARPLIEEVYRLIVRRGAHPIVNLGATYRRIFFEEASDEQLNQVPDIIRYQLENADATITIDAPENRRDLTDIDPAKLQRYSKATMPLMERFMKNEAKWLVTAYPTPALAQDAEMSLSAYEDFIFNAVNIDWKALKASMEKAAKRFDEAKEVRIVASGTDITLSLEGRTGVIDGGENNMPGGEFFYAPQEHCTEGTITYEWPAVLSGREVSGIRLTFKEGKVVEARADKGEDYLHQILETDAGARFVGELGIGCNNGIQQHTKNILFDEKIGGTVHLALGRAYEECGGTNQSAVHWDMVKDLRNGGAIYLDGQLVQKDGMWTF
ncbi:aminopeptidase [Marinithermofilum abyssi]|uniref:Aminopeptidase n=1 Tax=Marinithermofilum abyssi TaxID=1571185 RepID=A0A8J2VCH0_9BACL|nr:aminopeptidase [Marinithermofilum abyssi]GGE06896.1 aminopeptidase [Marinithermofilum abyssi]